MFSLVSTIFDPLGILSPLTIRIKMLLQQLWKLGEKWDEPLPAELHSNLQKVLDSYFAMPEIEIPRWLDTSTNQENNHQLLVFVDVLTVALAAVAYIRTQKPDEIFQIFPCLEKSVETIAVKAITVKHLSKLLRKTSLVRRSNCDSFRQDCSNCGPQTHFLRIRRRKHFG